MNVGFYEINTLQNRVNFHTKKKSQVTGLLEPPKYLNWLNFYFVLEKRMKSITVNITLLRRDMTVMSRHRIALTISNYRLNFRLKDNISMKTSIFLIIYELLSHYGKL